MDFSERWYAVDEFAVSFGSKRVSSDTVRRWIKKGYLKAFKFPKTSSKRARTFSTYMISESERQRFIRAHMTS